MKNVRFRSWTGDILMMPTPLLKQVLIDVMRGRQISLIRMELSLCFPQQAMWFKYIYLHTICQYSQTGVRKVLVRIFGRTGKVFNLNYPTIP